MGRVISREGETRERPVVGSFVGRVEGSDALIAIVASERDVLAFVCDGHQLVLTKDTISEWFRGARSGDDLDLSSEGGARLRASVTGRSAAGRIDLPGRGTLPFEALPASGHTGLYRAEIATGPIQTVAGWIVFDEATVRGASGLGNANFCKEIRHQFARLTNRVSAGVTTFDEEMEISVVREILWDYCLAESV